MINYPCIFKLEGDDELIYIRSEDELVAECESLLWSDEDYLVDSTGQRYTFSKSASGFFSYTKKGAPISVDDVAELIRAHEFSKAELCLTKIHFSSVTAAINSLAVE